MTPECPEGRCKRLTHTLALNSAAKAACSFLPVHTASEWFHGCFMGLKLIRSAVTGVMLRNLNSSKQLGTFPGFFPGKSRSNMDDIAHD